MCEIGYRQNKPTIIYEDNQAAILMTNADNPTVRTRHIGIQFFALQEWRRKGDLVLKYIPGVINIADKLTKTLGWVLHRRYVAHMMGRMGSPYTDTYGRIERK